MIASLSVPHGDTKYGPKIIRLKNEKLAQFPILFIDIDSFIVSLQDECALNLNEDYVYNVHIGKYCALAHEIKLVIDINHNYKSICTGNISLPDMEYNTKMCAPKIKRKGQILIQNDVWIGRGVTILAGVTIHNGSVIAANAVVTKDVAPYTIVGGNPARFIKYRFDPDLILKLLSIQWWNWSMEEIECNAQWFYGDVNAFTNHFYTQSLSAKNKTIHNIEKVPKQFIYFADFNEGKYATWEKVTLGFCSTFAKNKDCGLIVFITKDNKTEERYCQIEQLTQYLEAICQLYIFLGIRKMKKLFFK